MGKLILYVILALGIGGAWTLYSGHINKVADLDREIQELADSGRRGHADEIAALEARKQEILGTQTFNGILLAFLSAGAIGIFFVFTILPAIAHRFTHAIYDSAEMVETDSMHDARSLYAQGDYEGAVEEYREVAEAEPTNRLPWVEIAKIQRDNLKEPQAAIATLREALERREWELDDAAFFMFRLAEIYKEDLENPDYAVQILQQVCEAFPETRHSANARHKLNEFGIS